MYTRCEMYHSVWEANNPTPVLEIHMRLSTSNDRPMTWALVVCTTYWYNWLIPMSSSTLVKEYKWGDYYWYHMYCCDDTKWLPCWFLAPQTTVDCQLETTRSGLINRSRGLWDDWPVCSETLTINMVWCLCLLLDEKLTCPVSLSFVTGDRF